MKLLIGADLVPTGSNEAQFVSANTQQLVGVELAELLNGADYRIFNLEVPLTDQVTPIVKSGPCLIAPTATVKGIKALGADLLTLGNNHILDQGVSGLLSTQNALEQEKIACVGVGNNLNEAQKPYIVELEGKRIGVYACCEHEFSLAEEGTPGANPFDPLESLDHIAQLKAQCDYVIVLYHGGKEHYRYPSPGLQKVCRKLVQKGADLVLCQHSHCIGCEEKYLQGTIVYGQGNFLFDRSQDECWNTGLLVQVEGDFEVTYIPLVKNGSAVALANQEQKKQILDDFYSRSQQIQIPGFIEENYAAFADSMTERYLLALGAVPNRSFMWRVMNRLTGGRWQKWYLSRKYTAHQKVVIENFIDCEAHRELLLRGIKK